LTDRFYQNHIVNFDNDAPVATSKSLITYYLLHLISNDFGKIGVQIFFGSLSIIGFYLSYIRFKKIKESKLNWEDYKNSRIKKQTHNTNDNVKEK